MVQRNASVILDGGMLLGFIFIHDNEIQDLSVDVPYWGNGIAQQHSEVVLECFESLPRANRFYQKIGFTPSGFVEGDGGRRILYKKALY